MLPARHSKTSAFVRISPFTLTAILACLRRTSETGQKRISPYYSLTSTLFNIYLGCDPFAIVIRSDHTGYIFGLSAQFFNCARPGALIDLRFVTGAFAVGAGYLAQDECHAYTHSIQRQDFRYQGENFAPELTSRRPMMQIKI